MVDVKLPHSCSKCPARWNGYLTAHCAGCHETFTGITAWEKHRAGGHDTKRGRYCVDPEKSGLVPAGRAYPCWANPGTYEYEDQS